MKPFIIALIGLMLVAGGAQAAGEMEATTTDGQKVILHPDGTWSYQTETLTPTGPSDYNKQPQATAVLKSKKSFYELWYDPDAWSTGWGLDNPEAEFGLMHKAGDAYAMIIAERISMPLETLKNVALQNAYAVAPDAKIVNEDNRTVNGVPVLHMQIEGTIDGIPFTYYSYYWTGEAGSLQAITFTGQSLFQEYKSDFIDLLNGLVITRP